MNLSKRIILKNYLLFVVYLVLAGVFLCGCSQKKEKVYKVGILSGLDFFADVADGFKEKMTMLGYSEGKNIIYDLQKTNFDMAAYKRILKKFVADKVDMIFVFPSEASIEAKAATQGTNIPVVFAIVNVEGLGLINNIKEPGGNITGVRWPGPYIALQRFKIMCELVPQVKRMWIPYKKDYPIVKYQLETLRQTAESAGIALIEVPAINAAELEVELQKRANSINNTDAILIIAEPLLVTPEAFIVLAKFANEHNIPIGGALIKVNNYESLFGMTPRNVIIGRQAAFIADKILSGIPAGTIPVDSAEGYFQINCKAAKKMGLIVPENLLKKADEKIN